MDIDEAEQLLSRSEDELLAEIGRALLPPTQHDLSGEDLRRVIDVGRAWYDNTRTELRALLCNEPRVIAVRATADTNGARLLLIVIDVLSAQKGWPPPATVGSLVVKIGLDRMCADL